jgi:hypothetical protein
MQASIRRRYTGFVKCGFRDPKPRRRSLEEIKNYLSVLTGTFCIDNLVIKATWATSYSLLLEAIITTLLNLLLLPSFKASQTLFAKVWIARNHRPSNFTELCLIRCQVANKRATYKILYLPLPKLLLSLCSQIPVAGVLVVVSLKIHDEI